MDSIFFGVLETETNSPETFFDSSDFGRRNPSVHLIEDFVSRIHRHENFQNLSFKFLGDYLVDSKNSWCFGNKNEIPRDVFRFVRFWSTEPFGSPHQSSEVFKEIQGLVAFEQNVAGPGGARNYLNRSNTFLTHHLGPTIPMSIIARTPLMFRPEKG